MAEKTSSGWRHQCRPIIVAALAELPADATRAQAEKALSPLYPFGERARHPYRMWRAEVNYQLDRRYGKKAARVKSDIHLTAEGPLCRLCVVIYKMQLVGSSRCLACLPVWARWDAMPLEDRQDFARLMGARQAREKGADGAARDWSEEFMGGLPLEGKP